MIHRHNSYVPRGKQRTSRREAQSREPANKVKKVCVLQLGHYRLILKPFQFLVIILQYYPATLLYLCFFNEIINCEIYLRVERTAFSTPPVICEF
jgi:hypothetical protein